jgi:hypothetical protein
MILAGTCINNTSVMMFKKGSFEVGGTIYPVAIKVRRIIHSVLVQFGGTEAGFSLDGYILILG